MPSISRHGLKTRVTWQPFLIRAGPCNPWFKLSLLSVLRASVVNNPAIFPDLRGDSGAKLDVLYWRGGVSPISADAADLRDKSCRFPMRKTEEGEC